MLTTTDQHDLRAWAEATEGEIPQAVLQLLGELAQLREERAALYEERRCDDRSPGDVCAIVRARDEATGAAAGMRAALQAALSGDTRWREQAGAALCPDVGRLWLSQWRTDRLRVEQLLREVQSLRSQLAAALGELEEGDRLLEAALAVQAEAFAERDEAQAGAAAMRAALEREEARQNRDLAPGHTVTFPVLGEYEMGAVLLERIRGLVTAARAHIEDPQDMVRRDLQCWASAVEASFYCPPTSDAGRAWLEERERQDLRIRRLTRVAEGRRDQLLEVRADWENMRKAIWDASDAFDVAEKSGLSQIVHSPPGDSGLLQQIIAENLLPALRAIDELLYAYPGIPRPKPFVYDTRISRYCMSCRTWQKTDDASDCCPACGEDNWDPIPF